MAKLYKYRPLTEFLFKELHYQEIYFSSYLELNDPLDLSARIDFTPQKEKHIFYLVWFITKTTLKIHQSPYSDFERENNKALLKFNHDEKANEIFKDNIYNRLIKLKEVKDFISIDDLEKILLELSTTIEFKIDFEYFKYELQRLSKKFLENSHVTCFSEVNNDFLMWSHYASKHSGICIEFTLKNKSLFPYRMPGKRELNKKSYLKQMSEWEIKDITFWDEIKKVKYQKEQPFINFFNFSGVFDNEGDCDLIGLSKSWTHRYAYELENVFSNKTLPWKYEKEWRAIDINFGDIQEPEERIRHYPIECLSSIYFGIRTPETIKKRIYKILNALKNEINFFDCKPTNGRELTFEVWKYYED